MNELAAFVVLALFIQAYWLVPKRWQNPLLISATFIAGAWVAPLSFSVAAFLAAFSYWALTRGKKVSPIVVVAICLLPMFFMKLPFQWPWLSQIPDFRADTISVLGLSYFSFILVGAYLDLRRAPPAEVLAPVNQALLKPVNYFAFLSFFPILPIGPIERVANLGAQITNGRVWKKTHFTTGLLLISSGVFKKVVIADRLSELVVDVNRNSLSYFGWDMWSFALLSLLHVFADFSSVVDIVRGISRLLGFDVLDNFDRPYLASDVQDIWRRWHISLVSWLRDFVYAPVAIRTRSVVAASGAVMLAIGMWHEVSWRFLLWAAYWTSVFWVAVALRKRGIRINLPRVVNIFFMICLMAFSTLFIAPRSIAEFQVLAVNFFTFIGPSTGGLHISNYNLVVALSGFAVVVISDSISEHLGVKFLGTKKPPESRKHTALSIAWSACLLIVSIALAAGAWEKFIYLRY